MSMTFAQVKSLAMTLLDMGQITVTSSQWVDIINAANNEVFRQIVDACPDYFMTVGTGTMAAGSESVDLSSVSILGVVPYKLIDVSRTTTTAVISSGNLPTRLLPMTWAERTAYLTGVSGPSNEAGDPLYFTLQGASTLYVAPIPSSNTPIRVTYVPQLVALTTGDSATAVLGGRAPSFHDCVAYCAAELVNIRAQGSNQAVTAHWQAAQARIKASASPRQLAEPRFVRRTRRR